MASWIGKLCNINVLALLLVLLCIYVFKLQRACCQRTSSFFAKTAKSMTSIEMSACRSLENLRGGLYLKERASTMCWAVMLENQPFLFGTWSVALVPILDRGGSSGWFGAIAYSGTSSMHFSSFFHYVHQIEATVVWRPLMLGCRHAKLVAILKS